MSDAERLFHLKARLLCEGISVSPGARLAATAHPKLIHLYEHAAGAAPPQLPDDVVLGTGEQQVISRVRYSATSRHALSTVDGAPVVVDDADSDPTPVSFIPRAGFQDVVCSEGRFGPVTAGQVCSFLGTDTLGVVASNRCFYFRNGTECKFCEIEPSFGAAVAYRWPVKSIDTVVSGLEKAVLHEPRAAHLSVTSGNVSDYDYTVRMFIDLARRAARPIAELKGDVLATLMPPDDLALIAELRESGFTKVYFPLEVFARDAFERICPGKSEYGYDRILAALAEAVTIFGAGNVYTNLIYGLQSPQADGRRPSDADAQEHAWSLAAVDELLARKVIPAFTIYHTSGKNQTGAIALDADTVADFFKQWGRRTHASDLVPPGRPAPLFGPHSLANTLFNDGYALARTQAAGARRGS